MYFIYSKSSCLCLFIYIYKNLHCMLYKKLYYMCYIYIAIFT